MELFFGTAKVNPAYGVLHPVQTKSPPEEARAILEAAETLGFAAVDTAPAYGDAETLIGQTTTKLPVYTKLGHGISPTDSVLDSLQRLNRGVVEGVFTHEQFLFGPEQERVLQELEKLRGLKLSRIGASIYDQNEFFMAMDHPSIDIIQLPYNILDRRFSADFLRAHAKEGKEIIGRSVFLQGVLLQKPERLPEPITYLAEWVSALHAVAAEFGLSPLQASLNFARSNQALSALVVGASSALELGEIVSEMSKPVAGEFMLAMGSLDCPPWTITDPRRW